MKITISNDIVIEDPTDEIIQFCNNELKIPNPEYYKKQRMGLWLGKTPTHLYLYSRNGNKLHIPFGSWEKLLKYLPLGIPLDFDYANNPEVDYKGSVPLYDYQKEAVNEILHYDCGILQAPCGSGKTQIGISLAITLKKKTLWLTHTKDLLNQSYERAAMYVDRKLLGTITEGKVDIGEGITFATVQTMSKLDLQQYRFTWDLIIVDECHRCCGSPSALTMFSKVVNNLAAPRKYGLSATVHRSDGLIVSTFALLGEIIHLVPDEAVADRTVNVTIQEIRTGIGVSEMFQDTDGTIIYSELIEYLTSNQERSKFIAQKLFESRDHSNMILSDRLQHLRDIIEHLTSSGVPREDIRMIDGTQTTKKGKEQRRQALIDLSSGRAKYLFASYSLAKEGLDIPKLDRLFMASPKKDLAVVLQSIGRISRTAEGKENAICYDFVDNIGYCVGAWKKRRSIYLKKGCEIKEVPAPTKSKPNKAVLESLKLTSF